MIKCPKCNNATHLIKILDKHYAYGEGSERVIVYHCDCNTNFSTSQLYMFEHPITQVRFGGIIDASIEEISQY